MEDAAEPPAAANAAQEAERSGGRAVSASKPAGADPAGKEVYRHMPRVRLAAAVPPDTLHTGMQSTHSTVDSMILKLGQPLQARCRLRGNALVTPLPPTATAKQQSVQQPKVPATTLNEHQ